MFYKFISFSNIIKNNIDDNVFIRIVMGGVFINIVFLYVKIWDKYKKEISIRWESGWV